MADRSGYVADVIAGQRLAELEDDAVEALVARGSHIGEQRELPVSRRMCTGCVLAPVMASMPSRGVVAGLAVRVAFGVTSAFEQGGSGCVRVPSVRRAARRSRARR
jgi:hypothetical protein